MTGSPSNPDLTNIFISFMLFQTQTSQTYFGVSDWLGGGDFKARGSVGLKLSLIHSILCILFFTMLFWSRKPDGWRCLLPVSSGPYTDLGSACTMGLVLKALGSGLPYKVTKLELELEMR